MSDELPKGWIKATLAELGSWGSGGTPKRTNKDYYNGHIPWLVIGDLNDGVVSKAKNSITAYGLENSSAKLLEKGVLLIAMYGSIGKLGITDFQCATNQAIASCIVNETLANKKYLFYLLMSRREHLLSLGKGGAQQNISQTVLKIYEVPLAPLNEQIRIANKLDSLLAKVDTAQTRLERIPTLLKRFRQSVLAAATSGELTKKWREGTDFKLQIKTLGDTGTVVKTGPFGSALHKRDYVAGGIPIINPMHINHGKLMPSNSMTISTEKYLELSAWHLREGDVIVGRRGEMGRAAVVADGKTKMLCGTGSMILRVDDTALPKYLELILRSPTSVEYFIAASVGSTMVNLNQGVIKNLKVHFPPLQEQKEIVSRVESLFSVAESVEKQYTEAKKRTDRLTQSLLAKAFRGELVPQDTNDEPASELINRIQAEREQQAANKPKPKTVTKRKIKKK